ncbi:MAG: IS3 family transposase [Alphaproteobacteria bacterium]|nr:IS3 family transposase [Alphaproteobacteria bacterium]
MFKKTKCLSSEKEGPTTEEKVTVIAELRQNYKLNVLLKISGLPKATFFYTINKVNKDEKNEELIKEILKIYHYHKGRYGYRRISLELKKKNIFVNHKKIKRLMRLLGIHGISPRGKYKSYKGDMNGTCKNLLLNKVVDEEKHKTKYVRDFATTACNQKWTTDVSEFHIPAGKLYLSPILDMHNREIVAYNISANPTFNQTKDMLKKAFEKHENLEGLIFHSDQGWQYQMDAYHKELEKRGIRQSMSRKGNCLDNSPMENFFGIMKNEMFYGHEYEFKTLQELEKAMIEYIEYYNNERISEKTKGLSPIIYRQQSFVALTL